MPPGCEIQPVLPRTERGPRQALVWGWPTPNALTASTAAGIWPRRPGEARRLMWEAKQEKIPLGWPTKTSLCKVAKGSVPSDSPCGRRRATIWPESERSVPRARAPRLGRQTRNSIREPCVRRSPDFRQTPSMKFGPGGLLGCSQVHAAGESEGRQSIETIGLLAIWCPSVPFYASLPRARSVKNRSFRVPSSSGDHCIIIMGACRLPPAPARAPSSSTPATLSFA